ncbi:MAG TPA: sugar porter family MFS transporter [Verrucomicrobiae bacterium]|nr:sugar porter family MFS transporter [Verrucomicrobiae bacterium]
MFPLLNMKTNLYLLLVCLVGSAGGFLFGFDTSVISGVIGYISDPKVFHLSAELQGWTVSCIIVGCMIGCVFAGQLGGRLGRKKTLILSAIIFLVSSLGCALAHDYSVFIAYRIVAGLAVGTASMLAPIYIAEISPPQHRGKLVSLNLFAIFLGQFLSFFSNYLLRDFGGDNNWRWMIGVMAVPSFLFFIFLLFVPESPRWLAEKNHNDEAMKILTRINGVAEANREFAEIQVTIKASRGRFSELFQLGMRRILMIGMLLAIFQQITGINVVMYYAPNIFESAGFGKDSALQQTAIMGMVNLTFAAISMCFVDRMGRKPLMLIGSIGMTIAMTLLAITFISGHAKGYFVLACIMLYLASFGFSLGPVVFVLISEIFPNRLRSFAVAISTFTLWAADFVVSYTFPPLLNRLHGYSFAVYGSMCVLCLLFCWIYLEETKGKTLEEIEMDFTKSKTLQSAGVPAINL